MNVLMVPLADPGHRREGDDGKDDRGDYAPHEGDRPHMHGVLVLEEADDSVENPSEGGDGAAGVDSSEMLKESGEGDTPPEGGPLKSGARLVRSPFVGDQVVTNLLEQFDEDEEDDTQEEFIPDGSRRENVP